MGINPTILHGQVMHKRLFPKINAFSYGIYYLSIPLSQIDSLPLPVDCFGLMSFYRRDHGKRDGSSLQDWARDILARHNIKHADGEITLIAMPRILGYVFNPVSFWLCHDKQSNLRAVICEVNNTFGETHSYICSRPDQEPITSGDVLTGEKVFHVSPFLQREGHYTFRFDLSDQRSKFFIDYYDGHDQKQLITALNCMAKSLTKNNFLQVFVRYPLVTFKAIALIHWQALKLVAKGIRYIARSPQHESRVSHAQKITNL